MVYKNLEHRVAQYFLDMIPDFLPEEKSDVSIDEQKVFYNLMSSLYKIAFNEPLLFISKLHNDDAYPNNISYAAYEKPELRKNILKFTKAINELLMNMFNMGKGLTEIKLNKNQITVLKQIGITDNKNLPIAWTWMSTRPGANITDFSHCFFKRNYNYILDIYAKILGDEKAFRMLSDWMLANKYQPLTLLDVAGSDCKFSLYFFNPAWNKKIPCGTGETNHTGISALYEVRREHPLILKINIPNVLKGCLDKISLMDRSLQNFVIDHSRECNNCRYCVQTDKTGKRPLMYIKVNHGKQELNLCPLFAGDNYKWETIDNELARQIITFLSFMDKYVPN